MRRQLEYEPLTLRETFAERNLDQLRPLLALVDGPPVTRKPEIVEALAGIMQTPARVRAIYDRLDELSRKAIQEAADHPEGEWDRSRFHAKYGKLPVLDTPGRSFYHSKPTELKLFFPDSKRLPTDLRDILRAFVPKPAPLAVAVVDELPTQVRLPQGKYRRIDETEDEPVVLRIKETARAALLDVKAVLRLIDAGEVRVSEKTKKPGQAALKVVAGLLFEGDFYAGEDRKEFDSDPAEDLTMKAFAWPMLIQAAGLAKSEGPKLALTPAGRKATTRPAHEVIRQVWDKWLKTTLLDEYNRVEFVKGQYSKGSLAAIPPRRHALAEVLKTCPVGKWVRVEQFFRLLVASGEPFEVSRDPYGLYIGMQQYGDFGDAPWELVEGRYTLAFLFEYAATLGLLDVGYILPENARDDLDGHWGTDDMSCLSRYDGLMFVRINPLGAWCLGLAAGYEPPVVAAQPVLRVLPNLDVVTADRPLDPGDVLLLDRFADRTSEAVWHLSKDRVLVAVEQGLSVRELRDFLTARNEGPLPQTAEVFLDDLQDKSASLEDLGTARLIVCKDAILAQTLAKDRRLRGLCRLAGEQHLVFEAGDETAVRRILRELGHVLPPAR